jgi:hypothetical protein
MAKLALCKSFSVRSGETDRRAISSASCEKYMELFVIAVTAIEVGKFPTLSGEAIAH